MPFGTGIFFSIQKGSYCNKRETCDIVIAKDAREERKMEHNYEKRGYLLEDFRLFHLQDAQGTQVDYHYHEFHKLLLLRSGSGCYSVDGKRYTLVPGDIVRVGSRSIHRPEFQKGVPYERTIIYISPEFLQRNSTEDCDLEDCFREKGGHVLRLGDKRKIFSLADALEKMLSGNDYGRIILSNALLLNLLVEVGRSLQESNQASPVPGENSRVMEILRYLDTHLTEDVTIDGLAEHFYLSKYHMMRLFKRETGSSIHGYLTDRRLLYAKDLIAGGTSATEACFQAGWHSYSSFIRAYDKRFGTTPTGRKEAAVLADETFE